MKKVNTFYTTIITRHNTVDNSFTTLCKSHLTKESANNVLNALKADLADPGCDYTFTVLECVGVYTETFNKPEPTVAKKRSRVKK